MSALQSAVKNTRAGSKVKPEFLEPLLADCDKVKTYKWIRAKIEGPEAYTLVAKKKKVRGRDYKFICVKRPDKSTIPITSAKLYAKTSKCRTCGEVGCKRSFNLSLMREHIHPQIEAFKKETKKRGEEAIKAGNKELALSLATCPLSGKRLIKGHYHVDHAWPNTFSAIAANWCELNEFVLCDKKMDETQLGSFYKLHLESAVLQLVTAKANLKKGNRKS